MSETVPLLPPVQNGDYLIIKHTHSATGFPFFGACSRAIKIGDVVSVSRVKEDKDGNIFYAIHGLEGEINANAFGRIPKRANTDKLKSLALGHTADPYAVAPGVASTVYPDERMTSLEWFAYIGGLIAADRERRAKA